MHQVTQSKDAIHLGWEVRFWLLWELSINYGLVDLNGKNMEGISLGLDASRLISVIFDGGKAAGGEFRCEGEGKGQ